VQAAPSANGAIHAVTGMAHANYHSTLNCGDNVQVMTPQPGTDLMPVDVDTSASPDVEAFYARAARQQVTWLNTVECGKSNKINTVSYANGQYTTNSIGIMPAWSGYMIGGGTAAANHYAQSGWYVPTVMSPAKPYSANGSYDSSIWVGLGGVDSPYSNFSSAHPLIQAGTEQDVGVNGSKTCTSSGLPNNPCYYFWYEVYPQMTEQPIAITQMPISVGDNVAAVIFWVPGSNTAVLGVCNWNTNLCINFNVPGVGEPSNTTEWVIEAPSNFNTATNTVTQKPLAKFSPYVNFYNGCWSATTTFSVSSKTNTTYPVNATNGANGVTGSIGACQSLAADPSLTSIIMQPSYPPYVLTNPAATGVTAIQSNGSDFYIDYMEP
jgi:hypothetical protein